MTLEVEGGEATTLSPPNPNGSGYQRKYSSLNQRVHGSSPCAPTIEINGLQESAKIPLSPADPERTRRGQFRPRDDRDNPDRVHGVSIQIAARRRCEAATASRHSALPDIGPIGVNPIVADCFLCRRDPPPIGRCGSVSVL
jgi:hypothetical protein